VSARIADSLSYAHLWGTEELRDIFSESARLQGWLTVLAALARAQAAHGLIPAEAAAAITDEASVSRLDLDRVAEGTRTTGHSTQGLILELHRVLSPPAAAHVYRDATVQDITDTWTALTLRAVGRVCWRDLRVLEDLLLNLAVQHRDTLMCGRTHGQPGAPITFGWKAATWADEIRRHLDRLRDGDRIAEFGSVLAMIAGTLARFGTEVYELQRPEIGELGEPRADSVIGSITMHHKRNPEGSEHLATLARLVRVNAGVLMEGLVGEHERDGRTWKSEWPALPEVCLLAGQALQLGIALAAGLEVDADRMAANLATYLGSTQNPADPGAAPQIVDLVVQRARRAREQEAETWP
jgi:adenylosuccinate lyase